MGSRTVPALFSLGPFPAAPGTACHPAKPHGRAWQRRCTSPLLLGPSSRVRPTVVARAAPEPERKAAMSCPTAVDITAPALKELVECVSGTGQRALPRVAFEAFLSPVLSGVLGKKGPATDHPPSWVSSNSGLEGGESFLCSISASRVHRTIPTPILNLMNRFRPVSSGLVPLCFHAIDRVIPQEVTRLTRPGVFLPGCTSGPRPSRCCSSTLFLSRITGTFARVKSEK